MGEGTFIPPQGKVVGALTDGTGISPFNWTKFIKDFVADVLLSGAAALVAVGMLSVDAAVAAPQVAFYAVLGAVIRAAYRAGLRWATTG
jgi:hypothetical protein